MEPRIEILKPKQLIGIHMEMSLSNNKTAELWQSFMPRRKEVINRNSSDFISMQKYNMKEEEMFLPETRFEKWAVVEVSSFSDVPQDMETYQLAGGKYAVFIHRGPASSAAATMQYIFTDWLPNSIYELDSREHFEILPESYHPMDPEATEEIWIPIRDC